MAKQGIAIHRPEGRKRPRRRGRRLPFYDTARWRRLSKWYLGKHPLCEDPFGFHYEDGIEATATDVDHIQRVEERPDLAMVAENLQALCKRCHARKTNKQRQEAGA